MLRLARAGGRCSPGLQAPAEGVLSTPEVGYTEAVKAPGRRCAPVDGRGLGRRRGREPKAHLLHHLLSTAHHSLR